MKNLVKKSFGSLAIVLVALGTMSMTMIDGVGSGRIKVYLQNKCSSDVKVKVESPGSSTHYTVEDGYKKPFSFMEGTKIYDHNGKLVHTISSSSEGKVVVVCE
ncbi:MAG: hypothetical protein R2799_10185 [Crocinitomicaceae bacterium]